MAVSSTTVPINCRHPDDVECPKLGWCYAHLLECSVQRRTTREFCCSWCVMGVSNRHVHQWSNPTVIASILVAVICSVAFLLVELFVAREPVLAPFLLKQKIPVLVGISNFLVATCNFSIIYFFPMWFQTVMSTSASTAGGLLVSQWPFTDN